MIRLKQAVVVEGKYDRIKLSRLIDAPIIQTDGFRIFKDKQTAELIRAFAQTSGVIVATDSDAAGFKIRHYLHELIRDGKVIDLYLPDLYGVEKRKAAPSAEGKLGLEGMPDPLLVRLFEQAGATVAAPETKQITKATLYADGFSGRENSRAKRLRLLQKLNLPAHLSANALIPVLNTLVGYTRYTQLVRALDAKDEQGGVSCS